MQKKDEGSMEEYEYDEITGAKKKKVRLLNKEKLTKDEMDELFLEER